MNPFITKYIWLIVSLIGLSCSQKNNEHDSFKNAFEGLNNEKRLELILKDLGNPLTVDTLILSHFDLREIPDLSRYSNLRYLDLSNNAIEHLNWKAIMTNNFHIYGHKTLEYIDLSNNKISKGIPFINSYDFPNLKRLNLSNNRLSKFFIKGSGRLNTVDLSSNDLINVQIESQFIDSLNISNNSQLLNVVMDTSSIGYLNDISTSSYNLILSEEFPVTLKEGSMLKPNDSLQLKYYEKKVYSLGWLPIDMFTLTELKEWANEYQHTFINDFKVIHSTDHEFKIYEIIGEHEVGTFNRINMFYEHFIHFNLKDTAKISKIELLDIDRIVKMPDDKYLTRLYTCFTHLYFKILIYHKY